MSFFAQSSSKVFVAVGSLSGFRLRKEALSLHFEFGDQNSQHGHAVLAQLAAFESLARTEMRIQASGGRKINDGKKMLPCSDSGICTGSGINGVFVHRSRMAC